MLPDPYKTLLDWLAQSYTESCVLTNLLELFMLSISVSGSAVCAGCLRGIQKGGCQSWFKFGPRSCWMAPYEANSDFFCECSISLWHLTNFEFGKISSFSLILNYDCKFIWKMQPIAISKHVESFWKNLIEILPTCK